MRKEKILTPEEIRNNRLKDVMKELTFISEPTYFFKKGEKVLVGNLEDVYIEDVLFGGKVYEINYTLVEKEYGEVKRIEHEKTFRTWINVRKYQENTISLVQNDDIRLSFYQSDIMGLFTNIYSFGVNFNPIYQRDYVWELEDKVSLIDSMFKNIDIGKFAFIHNNDEKWSRTGFSFDILDGKQRTNAIKEYYEDKFSYEGYFYSDLSKKDKIHFRNYPISIGRAENLTDEQAMRYFVKLNKHGRIMDKAQIEKVENMIRNIDIV